MHPSPGHIEIASSDREVSLTDSSNVRHLQISQRCSKQQLSSHARECLANDKIKFLLTSAMQNSIIT